MRVILHPAFVLHSRPFSDTSLVLKLFTPEYGCIDLLARNARGYKSRFRGILLPFVPFLASWSGRTELKSLSQVENNGMAYQLQGKALICGMYLNELLVRLLPHDDAHQKLFFAYQDVLGKLQQGIKFESILRLFEKQLITELGYGLELRKDTVGKNIDAEQAYQFLPDIGFLPSMELPNNRNIFLGRHLLDLANNDLKDETSLRAIKFLMRTALNQLLGDKPIKTRELL